jgi:SAM-dependent methyltransferase
MTDDTSQALFFELFSGLPRQGPGDPDSTRRALEMVPPLDPTSRILDIGCGTGAQTFDLATSSPASIVAVDLHPPFVDHLNAEAAKLGLDHRVRAVVGDMSRLDFPSRHFDLLWSEGAIYNIGFEAGLAAWRRLLRPGGHIAVSDLCWLGASPPGECVEFFASEYPAMREVAARRAAVARCRYQLVGDFCLPPSAWWRDFYEPLDRNIAAFRARHAGDPVAGAIAGQSEREIEMYRLYSSYYGYVFFVMRTQGD